MKKTMTVHEVLNMTVEQLRSVVLPVELADTAMVIRGAIRNIVECVRAMDAAQKEADNGRESDTGERNDDQGTSD